MALRGQKGVLRVLRGQKDVLRAPPCAFADQEKGFFVALRGPSWTKRCSPWSSVDKKGVLRAPSRAFADQKKVFFVALRGPSWTKRCSPWSSVALLGQKRCSPRPPRPPRTKRDFLRAPPQAIPTPNSNYHRPAQSHQRTIAPPMAVVYLAPFPGYRPGRSLPRQNQSNIHTPIPP